MIRSFGFKYHQLGFVIRSEQVDDLKLLEHYYQHFPKLADDKNVDFSLSIHQKSVSVRNHGNGHENRFEMRQPGLAGSLISLIIPQLVSTRYRETRFFHGNALLDAQRGRLLFILGDSGAGKSTLTNLLLSKQGFSLCCEDVIGISSEGDLIPYPRTGSERYTSETPDALNWEGFGTERKRLSDATTAIQNDPIKLRETAGGTVFLKSMGETRAPELENSVLWLSSLTKSAESYLHSLPTTIELIERERAVGIVFRSKKTDFPDMGKLCSELIGRGSFVLGEFSEEGRKIIRPEQPKVKELKSSRGLAMMGDYEVFFLPHSDGHGAGERLFHLVKLLGHMDWKEVYPGGTPEETIASFIQV